MSRKPYNPTHGFQNLRSFAQWLWVFRPGQGYSCLTGGPKMISCKFGTEIFKNMHTVTKTNFWSAQSGFKNRQIASKRRNVEYRSTVQLQAPPSDPKLRGRILGSTPAFLGVVSSKMWSRAKSAFPRNGKADQRVTVKLRQKDAMLNIAPLYHFRPPLVIPTQGEGSQGLPL